MTRKRRLFGRGFRLFESFLVCRVRLCVLGRSAKMLRAKIVARDFGEKVSRCKLVRWHVKSMAKVEVGELLATLETKKVVTELESDHADILIHSVCEGELVEFDSIIGYVEHDGLKLVDEEFQQTIAISDEDLLTIDEARDNLSRDEYVLQCLRQKLEALSPKS